jgi:ornithine cyclodeaminase/alanine dehydrogenase
MPLLLSDEDVRSLVTMRGAIDALAAAFADEAKGDALAGRRANLMLPNGWIRLAAAAMPKRGIVGYKEFHLTAHHGVRYSVQLYDYAAGHLLALLDGNHITALRTGATAGVALQHLAPQRIDAVGVVGSGAEARTQLEAFAAVRRATRGLVFSPNEERRQRFCDEMEKVAGFELRPAASPEEVAREADVLLVATRTGEGGPSLRGRWLHRGMHVTSIGSTLPAQREIDEETWAVADLIVLDTQALLEEAGDAIAARAAGAIDERKIAVLADVTAGHVNGRTQESETTLYKSVGTPLQDIVTAAYVYEEAQRNGVGREVLDYQSLKRSTP